MAKQKNQNVPEVTINDEDGPKAFPEPPDNSASRFPGPGKIKCICVTKCYRDGLVKPGEIRYSNEVPPHFKAADDASPAEKPAG